jgi:hypothetical protein
MLIYFVNLGRSCANNVELVYLSGIKTLDSYDELLFSMHDGSCASHGMTEQALILHISDTAEKGNTFISAPRRKVVLVLCQ